MASGSASGAGSSPLGPAAAAAAAAATRAAIHIPPNPPRCSSSSNPVPPTLAAFSDFSDFARQLQAKQQHSNYHSSSLSTSLKDMVAASVNRTSLHPSGVQPGVGHTELEEELHETAHIDYERVSIIANPAVPSLYEDALVYETGTAITSTGALTAYSGGTLGIYAFLGF
ncbi:phosphoenolpyruvate carboxykinase [Histoplasma capsulatum var. duboisii H88]|uniref:Phosphoenolpyruvate carboxykinase n=1 Tax=Ajellomyces capsulatus (strain H88) TaxID=544711 RepID=A0A8A1LXG1_AJEC8|nr:phosphoenolpyruvate carboxykinase [Histoplasma capsulatum var. duboisii H88]